MPDNDSTTTKTQQISGYQMLSRLGSGAMATVYKAKQISLDRMVAIKILPKRFYEDASFIKRFYDEGRAAAKLNHTNIVQAFDVGYSGEYHYFVMEYVEGCTCHDEIQKYKKYSESRALEITIDIAEALAHSHEKGFIHRDVKPKNIMITPQGTAKLADMGLARAVSDREAAEAEKGKAFGTPYYIAPEQIRGELNIDARADIYSLGATLFHMVVGKVPFEGPNPSAVMSRHLRDELMPPDRINKELSSGISMIIEVCMAKNPAKRYANAKDLLKDLRCVQRGECPQVADTNFNLASLSALEPDAIDETEMLVRQHNDTSKPASESPLFWLAITGWFVAVVFIALFLLTIAGIF